MAENPATWGEAERIIHDCIDRHDRQMARDMANGEFRAGLSLPRQIADALRAENLLVHEYCTEHDQPLEWCSHGAN